MAVTDAQPGYRLKLGLGKASETLTGNGQECKSQVSVRSAV